MGVGGKHCLIMIMICLEPNRLFFCGLTFHLNFVLVQSSKTWGHFSCKKKLNMGSYINHQFVL